ncbi:hypothetical protein EG328_011191 [Venturia inaequalis]|uniref:Uncharacterized protein n=1 Tax=Venturia inaequalis TaxID=5025 RepID=A0A8H3VIK1_VENIN|nr:hypothetical protein EG328_011191 [Venturia inaequalis]
MSGFVNPAGSGTSHRKALGDITNSQRLNESGFEKPSIGLVSKKGHGRSKAISISVLELPKFLSKPPGVELSYSADDYSQPDSDLDDAANEGSQLSVDSTIDFETLDNTHANSPYLDRPTKNGNKELNNAVLGREMQPIDEPFEDLELENYIRPRTPTGGRIQSLVEVDKADTRERIDDSSAFTHALAEKASGYPVAHRDVNKVVEQWLETSSSIWNADVRLSASGITPTGAELKLTELEAASQFKELHLPNLDQLISAIERVGGSPENETKKIVVDVLRAPEVASKLRGFNMTIIMERFDAAIHCNHEEWEESEVSMAYGSTREEVVSRPGSVTPGSFNGHFDEDKALQVPAHLKAPSISNLDDLRTHPWSTFTIASEIKQHDPSNNPTPSSSKLQKKVSFTDQPTIIGSSDPHTEHISTSFTFKEIIKQAKALSRTACNVVPGIRHIQKQLFDANVQARMRTLDEYFSEQVASEAGERGAMLPPRRDSPFGSDAAMDVMTDLFGMEKLERQSSKEGESDTPFHISPDGFISAPLRSSTISPTATNDHLNITPIALDISMDEGLNTSFHMSPDGFISAPLPFPFPSSTLSPAPTNDSMESDAASSHIMKWTHK